MVLTMFVLRQWGGYKEYFTLDQFWGLGKLMFALSLLWFWFWFSSFIVLWYGKKPNEQAALQLLMVGPYLPIFFVTFITVFVIPLFTMIWNPLRKSIWGPTIIATSVLIGTFFDRIRLYVATYSVPGIGEPLIDKHEMELEAVKKMDAVLPGLPDVFMVIGGISAVILVYLAASRIIPVVNIWEQRELLLYKVHKPFHRTEVLVLGKPE
jgi:molybdopterin-containing oxidoreductase family membrane subunit